MPISSLLSWMRELQLCYWVIYVFVGEILWFFCGGNLQNLKTCFSVKYLTVNFILQNGRRTVDKMRGLQMPVKLQIRSLRKQKRLFKLQKFLQKIRSDESVPQFWVQNQEPVLLKSAARHTHQQKNILPIIHIFKLHFISFLIIICPSRSNGKRILSLLQHGWTY